MKNAVTKRTQELIDIKRLSILRRIFHKFAVTCFRLLGCNSRVRQDCLPSWGYFLPLRIAAITRGLRRPCITATTHKGFSSAV